MVRPMVHSTKHYVHYPIDQVGAGLLQSIRLCVAVESTAANLGDEVEEGSSLKAIFVELWLQNQGNLGEFICTLTKTPENSTGPTFVESANLFTYTNKKNVLYTTQGLTSNDAISGPVPVMRGWYKIPKSKQRFGLGDSIRLNIANVSANDLNRCGFSTYKEYS